MSNFPLSITILALMLTATVVYSYTNAPHKHSLAPQKPSGDSIRLVWYYKEKGKEMDLRISTGYKGKSGENGRKEWITVTKEKSGTGRNDPNNWTYSDTTRGSQHTLIFENNWFSLRDRNGDGLKDVYFPYVLRNIKRSGPDILHFVFVINNSKKRYQYSINQNIREGKDFNTKEFENNAQIKKAQPLERSLMLGSIYTFLAYKKTHP